MGYNGLDVKESAAMNNSVGTKARKKQSPLSPPPVAATPALFEQPLLALESACMRILESRFAGARDDIDGLYWQQRFKNIATPISLVLREYKGPRRFHNHYRHRADDDSILHPVLEDPLDMLAQVCAQALDACRNDLVGIYNENLIRQRRLLEHALQMFLLRYNKFKARKSK